MQRLSRTFTSLCLEMEQRQKLIFTSYIFNHFILKLRFLVQLRARLIDQSHGDRNLICQRAREHYCLCVQAAVDPSQRDHSAFLSLQGLQAP